MDQDRENGLKPGELVEKYSNFRLDKPRISRWMKQKDAISQAAAGEHKNLMKIRPSTRHNNLFHKLRPIFNEARSKGQIVDFNWLWSKARRNYRDEGKEEVVKKHVVVTFIRRNRLKYRKIQRNKNKVRKLFERNLLSGMGPCEKDWFEQVKRTIIMTKNRDILNQVNA